MEIIYFESLPSTNTALLAMSKKHAKSWTAIWTSEQSGGRGYAGNKWQSENGKNIAVSLLIKSNLDYETIVFFNEMVCNAIRKYLSGFSDEIFVKWPNDIILKNKKICGILIETHKAENSLNLIVGIGLNVNQLRFENLPNAGSLASILHREFDLKEILSALLTEIQKDYRLLEQKEFDLIQNEYNRYLYKKGKIAAFEKNGLRFNGIIQSVNHLGQLEILNEKGEIEKFNHKELTLHF
jgi:BirA family biotin operon repressor/biotin-[acetyl-CoA-carboxylase] ligase